MDIEFELDNKQSISIIGIINGERKQVGNIFTPSGSGHHNKGCIQVCGVDEAFDLWGCAVFAKPKVRFFAEDEGEYIRDPAGDKVYEQLKDIQLKFHPEAKIHQGHSRIGRDCIACYNDPCTCEVKIRKENPYTVKRSQDLEIEKTEDK